MASCPGKKSNNQTCYQSLYRCKKCGNVGCDRNNIGECPNQAFNCGKCMRCGANGQKESFN